MDFGRTDRPSEEWRIRATRRAGVVAFSVILVFALLQIHLFQIQVLGHDDYVSRRDRQSWSRKDVVQGRGPILDVNGEVLALSVPVRSVHVDPRDFEDSSIEPLAAALSLDAQKLAERVRDARAARKRFIWVKRKASKSEIETVENLRLKGVDYRLEFLRVYPSGKLASHLKGIVDIDDVGRDGVEYSWNSVLAGGRRSVPIRVDAARRSVTPASLGSEGASVTLTVHAGLQKVVEEELAAAVTEWSPKWAVAVVLDPRDGSLLALANYPDFDPNDPGAYPADHRRNRGVTDPWEPGSVLKPFFVAAALEEGKISPSSRFDCAGSWKFGSRTIHCHKTHGRVTTEDVIRLSCNIGAAKIAAELLGSRKLHAWCEAVGFGRRHLCGELPGESPGKLKPLAQWTPYYTSSSVSIGHEISVTPLQVANAMAAIANGGILRPVRAVRSVVSSAGRPLYLAPSVEGTRVFSGQTCRTMREMMVRVVEEGTGRRAKLDGVVTAGKTGTSQKFDHATGQYSHERYNSSFVGFGPAGPGETARMVVVVVLDEPQGAYYGGRTAAPAAGNILSRGLPLIR